MAIAFAVVEVDATQWRAVVGQPGYEVHPLGLVRSFRQGPARVLRPGVAKALGYKTVALGRGKTHCVHRLVAEAFIPNPEAKRTVNHKDGDKLNNTVANLEWATYSENLRHACRILRKRIGSSSGNAKLTEDDVLDIRMLRSFGAACKDIAAAFGVSRCAITHINKGRSWAHL